MAILQIVGWMLLIIIWQMLLRHIKSIWQKISIIYNLIYVSLINHLYTWEVYKKELLKMELKDLCYDVILNQNVYKQKDSTE